MFWYPCRLATFLPTNQGSPFSLAPAGRDMTFLIFSPHYTEKWLCDMWLCDIKHLPKLQGGGYYYKLLLYYNIIIKIFTPTFPHLINLLNVTKSHVTKSHILSAHTDWGDCLAWVTAAPSLPLDCASQLCLSIVPHNMLMVCAQRARGDGNSPSARVMLCAARVSSSKPGGSSRIA